MYKFLLILISIALIAACTSTEEKAADAKKGLTEEQKKIMLRKSEHVVDKSMELMDLPEYGIKTLTKKGDYQSKELLDAFTTLIKAGRTMKDVEHPEKQFNDFNKEMQDSFIALEKAVKAKDPVMVKKAWAVTNETCKKCHDVYE